MTFSQNREELAMSTGRFHVFKQVFTTTILLLLCQAANAQDSGLTASGQSPEPANDPSEINQLESPDGPKVESRRQGSELTGVLVDRTLTVVGKNFYRSFSQIAMGRSIIGGAKYRLKSL